MGAASLFEQTTQLNLVLILNFKHELARYIVSQRRIQNQSKHLRWSN